MNAVVRIQNGEADVWSGTQGPSGAQGLVARFSGLEPERVRAHQTYLGGSFGRRGTLTHIIESTQVAVATQKTIKLLWSREDDLKNGLYRPASLMRLRAGISGSGKITAWDATRVGGNISPETIKNLMPALFPGLGDGLIDWTVGLAAGTFKGWVADPSSLEGLFEDYDQPNTRVTHTTLDHGLPLTFWRSVGHSYTAFAKESMIDELALAAGEDEVAFRIKNTENNPRLQNVIRVAGDAMKAMTPAAERYLGFAAHHSFLTDVAQVAEVSVDAGKIRVHRVLCVVNCGIAVNPDIVRAQMEGAIMFGLTAALHGHHEIKNGAVAESNFHDYPILRMSEAPSVEVVIVESQDKPTGVGEPGLPPIAPAVANAVYRATGQRLRSLPLALDQGAVIEGAQIG
jgi:isoquinoline 1-oxidoreductase/isoquinoline 1-oxidoreductase beta subunit